MPKPTASRAAAYQRRRMLDFLFAQVAVILIGFVWRGHIHIELEDAEAARSHVPRAAAIGFRGEVLGARSVPPMVLQADQALALHITRRTHPLRIARHQ